MSKILKLAFEELGQKEIPGAEHNDRIVAYAEEAGITNINDDETPWCSIFVNWVSHQLGLEKSGRANARSWVNVGSKANDPKPGDVVVFWRESINSWKGHVGFFLGYSDDLTQVFCLGGNQGNAVSVAAYDAAKVLQFRRLADADQGWQIPQPVLKMGARGAEAEKLQNLLNHLDHPCGDPDGIFGNKTFNALKLFQANHHLTVDGIYGNETRTALEALMQE